MRILLISSYIFGYMEYAVDEMRRQGHEVVVYYYEKDPIYFEYKNLAHKLWSGIQKSFGRNLKKIYREKKLKEKLQHRKFDQTIIIHGQYLNASTHKFLKSISTIYKAYFFDSLAKMPEQKRIISYFDKVYSYEPKDCKNNSFTFITNFIPTTNYKSDTYDYQIFNIIGVDERFSDMQRLAKYFDEHKITSKLLLFSQKKYAYFEQVKSKMDIQEVFAYIKKGKIMLDIQRPIQEGLTFRVFEALGNDKKLITTNKAIVNYDFYDEENILILDLDNIQIPNSFLTTPFKPIPSSIIEKYTVQHWVSRILG